MVWLHFNGALLWEVAMERQEKKAAMLIVDDGENQRNVLRQIDRKSTRLNSSHGS